MVTEQTRFEKKLRILESMRKDIANKLDKSYLQNNVSDFLALENKYETIMRRIQKINDLIGKKNKSRAT